MNTEVINIKIDPALKRQAQRVSDELGLTISSLFKGFLKQLVDSKEIVLRVSEQPSDYLIKSLREAAADVKTGRLSPTFDNAGKAIGWLRKSNGVYGKGKVRRKVS